ncbi:MULTISPECIES: hypothetical protein [unclassified Ruegeria]|uniref:hypothetical protein n=1 Tax=unclassified Ruegeria TaxID=2625375 RepID=UPI001491828F|nr:MULTISPECIES: hypothetical protein [unclassified Ruegeria]NOD34305.1 hypothetical protein [Ruegeria sp. HKCCD7296]NOE41329.1 hypothetical protein [Ruegeria sp. HKCCD7319]
MNLRFVIIAAATVLCIPSAIHANCATDQFTVGRERVVQYLEKVNRVGGGVDEVFHHALSEASTYNGVVWWKVLDEVLAAEAILGHLQSGDYQRALLDVAQYTNSGLLSLSSAGSALSSSRSIANLASLPTQLALEGFAQQVTDDAFTKQVELYRLARSHPYNLTHQQILSQSSPHPDVLFDTSSGYLHTVGTQAGRTWVFRPPPNLEREAVYELIGIAYDANYLVARANREKQAVVDDFISVLRSFNGWSGPFIGGEWVGIATAGTYQIPYRWQVFQSGSCVGGTISLSGANGWKSYRFSGELRGSELTFTGNTWVTSGNHPFCIATGELLLSGSGPGAVLSGTWGPNSVSGGCPQGTSGGVHLELQ